MGEKRLRIVVIVRCPLCGGWIVGNRYGVHLENVHFSSLERGLETPDEGAAPPGPRIDLKTWDSLLRAFREELDRGPLPHGEVTPAAADELLSELGRRRTQGQNASLGFEVYE